MIKKVFFLGFFAVLIMISLLMVQNNRQQVQTSLVAAEGRLVEGNPSFPVIADAVIESSYRKLESGKQGYEAVYEVNISPNYAMLWYHDKLIEQGWTIYDESIEDVVTDLYIRARKSDQIMNVFAETEDGKTEITIEYPVQ